MSDDRAADVEVQCPIEPLLVTRAGKFETLYLMQKLVFRSKDDSARRANGPK